MLQNISFYLSDIDPVTTGAEGFALLGIVRKGCRAPKKWRLLQ